MTECIGWVDVESTGLDTSYDKLLEISLVISDGTAENTVRYTGPSLVLYTPPKIQHMKANANRVVVDMHTKSGLWDDLHRASMGWIDDEDCESKNAVSLDDLDRLLVDFVSETKNEVDFIDTGQPMYFGGSTVLLDRQIVERDLPMFARMFHYKNVDSSVLHTVASMNKNFPVFPKKFHFDKPHRALDDILESIEMYKHYLKHFGIAEEKS